MADDRTPHRLSTPVRAPGATRRKKTVRAPDTPTAKAVKAQLRPMFPGGKGGLVLNEDFRALYSLQAVERIDIIKEGVRAKLVPALAHAMGTSKEALLNQLGLPRATVDRKIRENRKLSQDESQRVVGMAKLIGLVETMIQGADAAGDFDAAKWLAQWVDEALPALGGRRPAEFLDTAEGQELIGNILQRMQSGAYG